ncbi:MAG: hypothetical protein VX598_01460, partial [Verrucomicrobiota bacterium]|nr:hypothetical protein [Verrucomicrobiota bacterium]
RGQGSFHKTAAGDFILSHDLSVVFLIGLNCASERRYYLSLFKKQPICAGLTSVVQRYRGQYVDEALRESIG